MTVPVHFYEEITGHGTAKQVVKQEFNTLDTDPDRAVRAGVRDCLAFLLSCAKQPAHSPISPPLTAMTTLHHYIDGTSGRTAVLYAVGGDQWGAMTKIVALRFAIAHSAQVHSADIQAALTRLQSYPGTWL